MTKDTVDGENTEYVQETSGEPGETEPIDTTDLNANVENQEAGDAGGADATETSGTCEEFQIMVQIEGMDSTAFDSFVANSIGKTGYHLEISRADKKNVVKELYFDNQTTDWKKDGKFTWTVNDLETKDANGKPIEYIIKEKAYCQSPSTKTRINASLVRNDGSKKSIKVNKSSGNDEAELDENLTFQQADVLMIQNQYNVTPRVEVKLALDGWGENPDVSDLKLSLAPMEGYLDKNRTLNINDAKKEDGVYCWTIDNMSIEQSDSTKIPYVLTISGYSCADSEELTVTAKVKCDNQETKNIKGQINYSKKITTLPEMTFFSEDDNTVEITLNKLQTVGGIYDTFQIKAQFKGMESKAFESFITSGIAKSGYYLEISRVDTGNVAKELYFENPVTSLREDGIFTWTVMNLKTKDEDGKPIEYVIKEKNYWDNQTTNITINALLTQNDGSSQRITVNKVSGKNQAVLDANLTFQQGDMLTIRNVYDGGQDTPQTKNVKVQFTLAGWDVSDISKLTGMKLDLAPAEGYTGTKKTLNIESATQDGNTFTWTVDDVEVEEADFTKIPYVITENGYPWSDSASITATANVICNTQKEQKVEGKLDQEKNTITFSSVTMCTEETDTIQITIDRGKCETFKIRTKLQGLDSSTLAELVKNSKADNSSGYYLAICRSDTGTIVKKLYLEDATPVTEAGTYGWEVNDLKTKDSSGNPISYIVKEINYQLKKSPTVDIDATLTDRDSLSVNQDTKNNQAVVNPAISFKASDTLEISHMYHVQYGNIKIQKTFDGLRDDDLESLINNSKSTAETGYYISLQEVTAKPSEEENSGSGEDSGEANVTKLYLDQATRAEKTFTWELKDVNLAEEDGTLIQYTIAEHNYLPVNYTLNYKRINVLASVNGREDPNIEVTQDEQQETVTLAPTSFSTLSEETLQITNQYYQIKRTGKIRIRTHLDGLKAEEIEKLCAGSKKGSSNGFYIEIKQVKKAATLRALSPSESFSERLYLSDAISESSDNTVFSWDIDDIPILDELNQPISYQISQHNYPVGGYAETIVSADVTRSDSTVSDIGTTPDTEHGVAGLDDVSFNSDLDTTVDTIDIRNSYTNDFNIVCYDKNGKAIENAQVTIKNPLTGEILATGVTAGAGAGIAAGTITIAGLTLPGGTVAVLTVAGTTIVVGLTAAGIYGYYKNRTNVIIEDPTKPDQPVTPDDPPKDPDDPSMKYITLTLKKEWKRAENEAPKGAKVKFSVYKSENGSTDAVKVSEVTMDGEIDNLEVRPWEIELKNLEGGIVQNKQVVKVYTYYVKEEPLDGYETTYQGETGTKLPLIPIRAGGKTIQAVWTCTGTDGNVTAINSEEYELPKTGGSGTWKYTTGGILLMTVSLLYGCTRGKKKRERRT